MFVYSLIKLFKISAAKKSSFSDTREGNFKQSVRSMHHNSILDTSQHQLVTQKLDDSSS